MEPSLLLVVTRDVAPYAVVAGNPARVVHRRFDDDQVPRLPNFRWWERSDQWIRDNAVLLTDPDVERLLKGYLARAPFQAAGQPSGITDSSVQDVDELGGNAHRTELVSGSSSTRRRRRWLAGQGNSGG